ncbi:hypothetical protein HanXRQr2_Chr12g0553251 [Helianthus annuus]|uniref:Uncharacterized protein n=1 Tax=Helianthus annuus TaxID=4232 RepID=A0A9K3HIE7_HELAN|nr:hypothetical protein HanXRQr2_Chr12g0553251 [Helianthus annuus]
MHGFKLREEDVKLPQYKNDDLVLNLIPELISRRLMAQNEIVKSVSRLARILPFNIYLISNGLNKNLLIYVYVVYMCVYVC